RLWQHRVGSEVRDGRNSTRGWTAAPGAVSAPRPDRTTGADAGPHQTRPDCASRSPSPKVDLACLTAGAVGAAPSLAVFADSGLVDGARAGAARSRSDPACRAG